MIPRGDSSTTLSKPRTIEKTIVCQICGDKGDLKHLIYCVQCKDCAEHSYCLEKLHKEDDGTVSWKCEDCASNDPKRRSEPLRKSKRISHATEAKYNRMKMHKESGSVKKQKSVRSSEGESADCLRKYDNNNVNRGSVEKQNSVRSSEGESDDCLRKSDIDNGNRGLTSKKRWLILEDESTSHEESESLKDPMNVPSDKQTLEYEKYIHSEPAMSQCLYYPEFDKCSRAQPLSDPVWRGQFRLNNTTHFGIVAHISSKACSKVHLAVTGLPRLLDARMLLRCAIWPQSFDMFPPDGNAIALFLFPQYERDEKVFDGVLNDVIERDLSLQAVINDVELLIFSSHLLPPLDRRICKKYYMWGVFKPKPRIGNTQSNKNS